METHVGLIKNLKRNPDKKQLYDIVSFLLKILNNIIVNPDDSKYRTLSCANSAMAQYTELESFTQILIYLGFRRRVCDFKAHWHLEHLNMIGKVRMQDMIAELSELNESLYPFVKEKPLSFFDAKKRKEEHRAYVDNILRDAEEDRLEKLRREEVFVQKARRAKEEKHQEELTKLNDLRRDRVGQPPVVGSLSE